MSSGSLDRLNTHNYSPYKVILAAWNVSVYVAITSNEEVMLSLLFACLSPGRIPLKHPRNVVGVKHGLKRNTCIFWQIGHIFINCSGNMDFGRDVRLLVWVC